MGWLGLKLEYRDVPELLENCKICVFTAQRSLGHISAQYKDAEGIVGEVKQEGRKIRYRSGALYRALYTCQCWYNQCMSFVQNQVYYMITVFQ